MRMIVVAVTTKGMPEGEYLVECEREGGEIVEVMCYLPAKFKPRQLVQLQLVPVTE